MPEIVYVVVGGQLSVKQTPILIANVCAQVAQEESPEPCHANCMAISKCTISDGWGKNQLVTQASNLCLDSSQFLLLLSQLHFPIVGEGVHLPDVVH